MENIKIDKSKIPEGRLWLLSYKILQTIQKEKFKEMEAKEKST